MDNHAMVPVSPPAPAASSLPTPVAHSPASSAAHQRSHTTAAVGSPQPPERPSSAAIKQPDGMSPPQILRRRRPVNDAAGRVQEGESPAGSAGNTVAPAPAFSFDAPTAFSNTTLGITSPATKSAPVAPVPVPQQHAPSVRREQLMQNLFGPGTAAPAAAAAAAPSSLSAAQQRPAAHHERSPMNGGFGGIGMVCDGDDMAPPEEEQEDPAALLDWITTLEGGKQQQPLQKQPSQPREASGQPQKPFESTPSAPAALAPCPARPRQLHSAPIAPAPQLEGVGSVVDAAPLPDPLNLPAATRSPAELMGPGLGALVDFGEFNTVQARCAPALVACDANVVVAAPTGSGKTVLLELALIRLFRDRILRSVDGAASSANSGVGGGGCGALGFTGKAVYICPIKALAQEKYDRWAAKFAPFGIRVVLETGDGRAASTADAGADGPTAPTGPEGTLGDVMAADVVVATPERWDSISRRWRQGSAVSVVSSVRLLLVDEVHVLGEARGAVIEALVSRMKTVASELSTGSAGPPLRFVAVSGTMSNSGDVASWLEAPPSCHFHFTDADRPIKLATHVVAVQSYSRNPFQFAKLLTCKMVPVLREYSAGKPALVFCPSRRETSATASHIAQEVQHELTTIAAQQLDLPPAALKASLLEAATRCADATLKLTVPFGVGFHHAGLGGPDRQLVQRLFHDQVLRVVCCTSTLALGVNLPARLVIVKGTAAVGRQAPPQAADAEAAGGFTHEDLPLSEVMQMCGRAGRPGLDTEGVAVVLTQESKLPLYEQLDSAYTATSATSLAARTRVESQLHRHMVEHVNAEIVLGTITNSVVGAKWLQTTFLWVRLLRNPRFYGISAEALQQAADADDDSDGGDDYLGADASSGPAAAAHRPRRVLHHDGTGDADNALLAATSKPATTLRVPPPMSDAQRVERAARTFARTLVRGIVKALVREGCVDVSRRATIDAAGAGTSAMVLVPTALGRLMAQYYVSFATIAGFNRTIGKPFAYGAIAARFADLPEAPVLDDDTAATVAGDEEADVAGFGIDEDHQHQHATDGDDVSDGGIAASKQAGGKKRPSVSVLLEALCRADEFEEFRLRMGDKQHLNALNTTVRFPVRSGKIDPKTGERKAAAGHRDVREAWHKAFLLLQASVTGGPTAAAAAGDAATTKKAGQNDWALRNDGMRLFPIATRLSRALTEYCVFIGNGAAVTEAWRLARSLDKKLWFDTTKSVRQLEGVGEVMTRSLDKIRAASIPALLAADPRRIEAACGRHAPFGTDLQNKARTIPTFTVTISAPTTAAAKKEAEDEAADGGTLPAVQRATAAASKEAIVALVPLLHPDASARRSFFTLVVTEETTHELLCLRRVRISGQRPAAQKVTVKLPCPLAMAAQARTGTGIASLRPGRVRIQATLINENFVGLDAAASYSPPMPPSFAPRRPPQQQSESVKHLPDHAQPQQQQQPRELTRTRLATIGAAASAAAVPETHMEPAPADTPIVGRSAAFDAVLATAGLRAIGGNDDRHSGGKDESMKPAAATEHQRPTSNDVLRQPQLKSARAEAGRGERPAANVVSGPPPTERGGAGPHDSGQPWKLTHGHHHHHHHHPQHHARPETTPGFGDGDAAPRHYAAAPYAAANPFGFGFTDPNVMAWIAAAAASAAQHHHHHHHQHHHQQQQQQWGAPGHGRRADLADTAFGFGQPSTVLPDPGFFGEGGMPVDFGAPRHIPPQRQELYFSGEPTPSLTGVQPRHHANPGANPGVLPRTAAANRRHDGHDGHDGHGDGGPLAELRAMAAASRASGVPFVQGTAPPSSATTPNHHGRGYDAGPPQPQLDEFGAPLPQHHHHHRHAPAGGGDGYRPLPSRDSFGPSTPGYNGARFNDGASYVDAAAQYQHAQAPFGHPAFGPAGATAAGHQPHPHPQGLLMPRAAKRRR